MHNLGVQSHSVCERARPHLSCPAYLEQTWKLSLYNPPDQTFTVGMKSEREAAQPGLLFLGKSCRAITEEIVFPDV